MMNNNLDQFNSSPNHARQAPRKISQTPKTI